jgi:Protein of unknown function (DUF3102)
MTTDYRCGDNLPVPSVANAPNFADRQVDSGFDYNGLPSNIVSALFERRATIRAAITKTTQVMIAIGRDLLAAKKALGHGRFVDWVEMECRICIRTAQNYMAVARISTKYAFVAYLPAGTALRLAHTPGRRELLEKISATIGYGTRPTEGEVRGLLEKFKKLRQLAPKQGRGPNRRKILEPVERPSSQYCGHTKSEYARLNAEFIRKNFGPKGLLTFRMIVTSGTVDETLKFVEIEIRRWELERGLRDLTESSR